MKKECINCQKILSKNEIGIDIKLLGDDDSNYYCIDCLAEYLEVSKDDLLAKIEEFKSEGCVLFS